MSVVAMKQNCRWFEAFRSRLLWSSLSISIFLFFFFARLGSTMKVLILKSDKPHSVESAVENKSIAAFPADCVLPLCVLPSRFGVLTGTSKPPLRLEVASYMRFSNKILLQQQQTSNPK